MYVLWMGIFQNNCGWDFIEYEHNDSYDDSSEKGEQSKVIEHPTVSCEVNTIPQQDV